MTLTDWYSGDQKPARPGVYEREYYLGDRRFSLWNGKRWSLYGWNPDHATERAHLDSVYQTVPWRGLAK